MSTIPCPTVSQYPERCGIYGAIMAKRQESLAFHRRLNEILARRRYFLRGSYGATLQERTFFYSWYLVMKARLLLEHYKTVSYAPSIISAVAAQSRHFA